MKKYIVTDATAGDYRVDNPLTEQELIAFANDAHFVKNGECEPAKTIEDAICILNTDFFEVKEIQNEFHSGKV